MRYQFHIQYFTSIKGEEAENIMSCSFDAPDAGKAKQIANGIFESSKPHLIIRPNNGFEMTGPHAVE